MTNSNVIHSGDKIKADPHNFATFLNNIKALKHAFRITENFDAANALTESNVIHTLGPDKIHENINLLLNHVISDSHKEVNVNGMASVAFAWAHLTGRETRGEIDRFALPPGFIHNGLHDLLNITGQSENPYIRSQGRTYFGMVFGNLSISSHLSPEQRQASFQTLATAIDAETDPETQMDGYKVIGDMIQEPRFTADMQPETIKGFVDYLDNAAKAQALLEACQNIRDIIDETVLKQPVQDALLETEAAYLVYNGRTIRKKPKPA